MTITADRIVSPHDAREQLAVAAGFALLVAGLLLLAVVLPAEYGLDPFGTGEALGLTALAEARTAAPVGTVSITTDSGLSPAGTPQTGAYKTDATTFTVRPGEGLEYKYRLEKGAGMVYAWQANGPLKYEFHGDPDGAGGDAFQSYQKLEGDRQSGSLVAPFSGIHGWFWENGGGAPITITLTSVGFYSGATEFRDNKRISHDVADPARARP